MGWRDDPVVETASTDPSTPAWAKDSIISPPASIDFNRPNEQVRADIARLPENQRKAVVKAWADSWVAKERKGGGVGLTISDTVRNISRGTPVGSWLDEANAATSDVLHRMTGGYAGAPYDEAVEYQRATDRAADAEASKLFRIPGTEYDVTTADLAKVGGGIASIPVAPAAQVFRGGTILPQMGNAAITGMGYGAVYGAGQGEEAIDRLKEGGKGAAIGGTIGPAAVPVARAFGNAVGATTNAFRRRPPALQPYSRGAVDRVARAVADDDLPARYQQHVADLGPEGMLADMGINLRGQAGAIANQPGPGAQRITDALHNRREGAAGRIAADVDQALGPPANIPETVHATREHYRAQAAPHRQQFQKNPVPFTQDLDDTLQLLVQNEPGVIRAARRYANIDPAAGPNQFFARQMPDGSFQITRVPNATEWDYLKRALDGLARGQDANDQRIYGNLARRLRTQVDDALSPGAPDQSPWAQARRLEAEDFQIRDAIEQGRHAFDRGSTPDQMAADMFGVGNPPRGGMTPPEAAGYMVGAREGVRSIMGNASTAAGENAATAARSRLGSGYAREKLDLLAGPQAAGQLTRRVDAETVFDNTRQQVTQNSATARRLAAQAEFPNPTGNPDIASDLGKRGLFGSTMEVAYRIGNTLLGGAINERRMNLARDAAEMLVAQGHPRQQIANGLFLYASNRQHNQAQRDAIFRLMNQVLQGSRQRTIEAFDGDTFPQFVLDAVNRRTEGDRRKVLAE